MFSNHPLLDIMAESKRLYGCIVWNLLEIDRNWSIVKSGSMPQIDSKYSQLISFMIEMTKRY